MKRIAVAFLLAPFPAAFIQSVAVAVWPKKGMGVFEHPASMFVAMCLLFYVFELVLALPLYLAVRKRLPRGMFSFGLVGALIILLPIVAALIVVALRGHLSTYVLIYNLVLFGLGGFLAGAIFWRIAAPRTVPAPRG